MKKNPLCPICATQLVAGEKQRFETLDEHVCSPDDLADIPERETFVCPNAKCKAHLGYWSAERGEWYGRTKAPNLQDFDSPEVMFGELLQGAYEAATDFHIDQIPEEDYRQHLIDAHGLLRSTCRSAMTELEKSKHQTSALAKALGDIVTEIGITKSDLTGPDLILCAQIALKQLKDLRRRIDDADTKLATLEDTAKGFEGNLVSEARAILRGENVK